MYVSVRYYSIYVSGEKSIYQALIRFKEDKKDNPTSIPITHHRKRPTLFIPH